MNYKINKYILKEVTQSYASGEVCDNIHIDCYEGINNLCFSSQVINELDNLQYYDLQNYPQGNTLKKALISYWGKHSDIHLDYDNIVLTEGSINGIYLINRLFLEPNNKVLAYIPQFPEYAMDVRMHGCIYDYYTLNQQDDYKFNEDEFIKFINDRYKIIYIDNPNNPTGQIIPLSKIKKIVKFAKENEIILLIDEAYGDYMDLNNSSINLLKEYDNIIVLKTFSKCFAMAGIRAGYMIIPKELYPHINKITNPYCINEIGRKMATTVLNDDKFINDTINKNILIKSTFLKSWHNLKIYHTSPMVSIFLLHHKNPSLNLQNEFARLNISVVNGESFMGLNKNYTRLRIPKEEDLPKVLHAFKTIDEL